MKRHWLLILPYVSHPPLPAPSGTISIWKDSPRVIWLGEVFLRFGSISFTAARSCSSGTSKLHRQRPLQHARPFPLGDSGCLLWNFCSFRCVLMHGTFEAFSRRSVQDSGQFAKTCTATSNLICCVRVSLTLIFGTISVVHLDSNQTTAPKWANEVQKMS